MRDSGTYALVNLFSVARANTNLGIGGAWAVALGSEQGSHEFARKMSETMALLHEALEALEHLPLEPMRDKYQRYSPAWLEAVCGSRTPWNQGVSPEDFLSQAALDQLDSLADTLELRSPRGGESPSPDKDKLSAIRDDAERWVVWLADAEIPVELRRQLSREFEQVVWLVDNAAHFGSLRPASRLQAAADQSLLRSSAHVSHGGVRELLAKWMASSTLAAQVLAGPAAGAALVNQSLSAIKTGIELIQGEPQKALPYGPPKAIGPADGPYADPPKTSDGEEPDAQGHHEGTVPETLTP